MSIQTVTPRPGYLLIPQGIDRRAAVRHEWNLDALGQVSTAEEGGTNCLVELHDLASGGVGLILNRFFEPGTILEVELHHLNKGASAGYLIAVIHSTDRGDGTWFVGCRFTDPISEEEMTTWL